MAELGVGNELPVQEHRRADTGAESRHDHDAADVPAGSEGHLGDARGIGVVDHGHPARAARQRRSQGRRDVGAHPDRVDVGRGPGRAALDDGGKSGPDRARPAEVRHDLRDGLGDGRRLRRLRCGQPEAGRGECSLVDVDGCTLDTGTADVDTEDLHVACVLLLPPAADISDAVSTMRGAHSAAPCRRWHRWHRRASDVCARPCVPPPCPLHHRSAHLVGLSGCDTDIRGRIPPRRPAGGGREDHLRSASGRRPRGRAKLDGCA